MQRIVILGSGESGTGAAILAKQLGHDVFVSDKGLIKESYKKELLEHGIEWEEGQHSEDKIFNANEIIKSPGIPEKADLIKKIRERGINIIGEIEFAFRHAGKCKIIAITGSNGKTTTTTLTHHLCEIAGLQPRLCGNVGFSVAKLVADDLKTGEINNPIRLFVCEISSFQLDDCQTFKPDVAVLLNITPDHLDRYDYKLENYVRSKFSIIKNQSRTDVFIYNSFDPIVKDFMRDKNFKIKAKKIPIRKNQLEQYRNLSNLRGVHNFFNCACAVSAAISVGANYEKILGGLKTYNPPPHRLEIVKEINGIEYINDSKATNVDSVFYALQALDRPLIWIVGGTDKGNDYSPILKLVKNSVKAIVCLGVDNSKLFEVFGKMKKPMIEANSAKEAVELATNFAKPGDVVLLSPACASFDLFKNYEDRGDQFRAAVLSQ